MKSWGFTINLIDEKAAVKYKEMHKNVYPEITQPGGALEGIGIYSMKIFTDNDLVFMCLETKEDFVPMIEFDRANTEFDPKVKEWDDIMHGQLLNAQHWKPLESVFEYHQN